MMRKRIKKKEQNCFAITSFFFFLYRAGLTLRSFPSDAPLFHGGIFILKSSLFFSQKKHFYPLKINELSARHLFSSSS